LGLFVWPRLDEVYLAIRLCTEDGCFSRVVEADDDDFEFLLAHQFGEDLAEEATHLAYYNIIRMRQSYSHPIIQPSSNHELLIVLVFLVVACLVWVLDSIYGLDYLYCFIGHELILAVSQLGKSAAKGLGYQHFPDYWELRNAVAVSRDEVEEGEGLFYELMLALSVFYQVYQHWVRSPFVKQLLVENLQLARVPFEVDEYADV
jgi:hypothetical protein